ncbi:MAG: DUF523 domain-containing protein [Gammaproteobacteria bacterium]|nr:DUF523 domain-containing protein [Gammaproteobacteria bacterium]
MSCPSNYFHPRIGISSCLFGERVRYDGQSRAIPQIIELLSKRYELIPLCPEVGGGLSVPRPPVELVLEQSKIRALGRDDRSLDVTDGILDWGEKQRTLLSGLSGYIFKARSPSCGLQVPLFDWDGGQEKTAEGLFVNQLQQWFPRMPLEDEEGVMDSRRLDCFLRGVDAYIL